MQSPQLRDSGRCGRVATPLQPFVMILLHRDEYTVSFVCSNDQIFVCALRSVPVAEWMSDCGFLHSFSLSPALCVCMCMCDSSIMHFAITECYFKCKIFSLSLLPSFACRFLSMTMLWRLLAALTQHTIEHRRAHLMLRCSSLLLLLLLVVQHFPRKPYFSLFLVLIARIFRKMLVFAAAGIVTSTLTLVIMMVFIIISNKILFFNSPCRLVLFSIILFALNSATFRRLRCRCSYTNITTSGCPIKTLLFTATTTNISYIFLENFLFTVIRLYDYYNHYSSE